MKEVSCRVLDLHFRALREQGLPAELLAKDTPYDVRHLQDKNERIEWSVFAQVMRNASEVWNDAEFLRQGSLFPSNPLFRPFSLVGRLMFDAREFYLWLIKPGSGAGNQLFTCVQSATRDLGPDKLEITVTVPEGYEPVRPFFILTRGTFIHLPKLLALPPTQVDMREIERGAVYEITIPPGGGALSKLRKAVTQPFLAGAVAEELKDAHVTLTRRYDELERTQAVVDRQATQLRTAHTISQVVHGDLDLNRVVDAVARALVEVAGFAAAEVSVKWVDDDHRLEQQATVGTAPSGVASLDVTLQSRGRDLGRALLWPAAEADVCERKELLAYVVPTISMAIDNALSFAVVEDFRANLAAKVEARTSELAEARDDLQHAVDGLEEAQAARDRIFANVNHELRTPLSNIALSIHALRDKHIDRVDERARAVLDGIDFNVAQLLHLMDGLLLLAAGQAGRLELRTVATDLGELCRRVLASWQPAAERAGIALTLAADDEVVAAVDSDGLARVLSNLLSNAIKYTGDGGRIDVTLRALGERVELSVRDSGVGMDDALRRRVFERFEQGPAPVRAASRGAGVGLAIVKELVNAHGGEVEVDSAAGKGSEFRVTLPADVGAGFIPARPRDDVGAGFIPARPRDDVGAGFIPARPRDDVGAVFIPDRSRDDVGAGFIPAREHDAAAPPGAATLLIAEDEPQLRRAIAELLATNYHVIAAANGEEALALAEEHRPDLLLTDISMPRMDGHELARRFRELPGNRMAPVLMLTAHGQARDKLAGFEAGAIDYMLKPFDPLELAHRVRAQLRQRELAVRLSESERLASLAILSAGLAHEFRNPANGIINAVELLEQSLPPELLEPSSASGELFALISNAAAQLRALCKQLLGFAGPGRLELSPQPLAPLIERARSLAEGALSGVELRTRIEYAGALECAGPFVVQVLVNLLENAAQAAGDGGWVALATRAHDHCVVIQISDSGPGVPPRLRDKVFEPFFTTKPPGVGTGLGLPVARRIIEQHGGRLQIVALDDGSAFEVRLPMITSAAAE